jgi:hypothetical protein
MTRFQYKLFWLLKISYILITDDLIYELIDTGVPSELLCTSHKKKKKKLYCKRTGGSTAEDTKGRCLKAC